MQRLANDKHSSVLQKSVSYSRKKFYGTGPRSHLQHILGSAAKLRKIDLKGKTHFQKYFLQNVNLVETGLSENLS
jgi:hypothetical protein